MKRLLGVILAILVGLNLSAQNKKSEPADSLVRLMSAQSAQMIQSESGNDIRKVIGPARFLHNGTYLICDTALWYVDSQIIKAFGHVKILQDETVLTSDKLDYYIEDDLAQFRGSVVQLQDKERNTLRTRNLDYNTKDSVAVFRNGGAMKDKDGQVIESDMGSYDSKTKVFSFNQNVNMFTDSVFVLTKSLIYHGDSQEAEFNEGVDAWKDENMLSADRGYYDRANEIFHFYHNVHGMTDVQEGWSDTLHFYRLTKDIELQGSVQLRDTSRKVSGMAEHIFYVDSTATLTMDINATVVAEVEDTTNKQSPMDTIYMGADRIVYRSVRRCDIGEDEVSASAKRMSDLAIDPVAEYRKKAAEDAAAAAEEAKRKREEEMGGNRRRQTTEQGQEEVGEAAAENQEENPEAVQEEVPGPEPENVVPEPEKTEPAAMEEPSEGGEASSESATGEGEPPASPEGVEGEGTEAGGEAPAVEEEPQDTTKLGFIYAVGQVRVFKSDIQARCDSLAYNELDSLARMYMDPLVWNEGNRQYASDSLTVVSENGHMRKASLMSNAFITIQEDTLCFDQIRGAEMTAFFDSTSVLERFDAMGSASAVFFLEENDVLATVNKVESKMLTANFKNGEIEKIYYYDSPHNNAYPAVQLPKDDRQMKGFRWHPDLRPSGKEDVTPYDLREIERDEYSTRPRPEFRETDIYFPGYMEKVYGRIAERDSLRKVNKAKKDLGIEDEPLEDPFAMDEGKPETVGPEQAGLLESSGEAETLEASEAESAGLQGPSETGGVSEESPEGPEKVSVSESEAETATEVPQGVSGESPLKENEIEVSLNEIPELLSGLKTPGQTEADAKAVAQAEKAAKKAADRAEREAAAAERQAAKEAKWAEKDAKDQAKAEKKAAKRNKALRKKAAKIAAAEAKEAAKEQKLFDRYVKRYEISKAKEDAKAQKKAVKTESDVVIPEQTDL